jgi:hypothetical protein
VNAGVFTKDDATVTLAISHQYGKRQRRLIKLSHSKVSADPYLPSTNVKVSMSVGLTIDTPVAGYTVAEAKQIVDALAAWLSASSGANTTKVLGGEN